MSATTIWLITAGFVIGIASVAPRSDVIARGAHAFLSNAFIADALHMAAVPSAYEQRERGQRDERVARDIIVRRTQSSHV